MFEYEKLTKRYQSDAAFNKAVNLFRQLIEQYGFSPSEIREGVFLAQYMYEMGVVEQRIRTNEEWEQFYKLKALMQQSIVKDFPALQKLMTEGE